MCTQIARALSFWLLGLSTLGLLGPPTAAAQDKASDASTLIDARAAQGLCPALCDDGNPCTVDSCDRRGRCRNVDIARCGYPSAATARLPSGSSCTAIPSCSIPDRDGDGLNDAWEIQGGIDLDCDGKIEAARDLLLPRADPHRPDVYLEYDYMVLPDQGTACAVTTECGPGQSCVDGTCRGHSHKPQRKAIRAVVDAFARKGMALHVDRGRAIPHSTVVTFDAVWPPCAGDDAVNFYELKRQHMDPRRKLAYHYAVFGHYNTCPSLAHCASCPGLAVLGATGKAELPGNDFIVSTGAFVDFGFEPWIEHEAGLVMHELGHNFGLLHGGNEHIEYKPNYLSAVNGSFTFVGIPVAAEPGSAVPLSCRTAADCPKGAICGSSRTCTRIDYSGEALPDLDENHLDESAGLGAGSRDITGYNCPASMGYSPAPAAVAGPVDWNCDGAIQSGVAADVNGDGLLDRLGGYADWPNLQLKFQCTPAGSADGPPPPESLAAGQTVEEALRRGVLFPPRAVELQLVPAARGKLAVAVLGSADLDVHGIDVASLKLDGAATARNAIEDVNGDGRLDLVATFAMAAAPAQAGPARLTGRLLSTQRFVGEVPLTGK